MHVGNRATGGVPERVYAVDAARHVLPVIDVCGFGVENLKERRGSESGGGDSVSWHACATDSV